MIPIGQPNRMEYFHWLGIVDAECANSRRQKCRSNSATAAAVVIVVATAQQQQQQTGVQVPVSSSIVVVAKHGKT